MFSWCMSDKTNKWDTSFFFMSLKHENKMCLDHQVLSLITDWTQQTRYTVNKWLTGSGPEGEFRTGLLICPIGITWPGAQQYSYKSYCLSEGLFTTSFWDPIIIDRRGIVGLWYIKNLITNCVINRLMFILFSFQSRNFIKLNKSKH